MHRSIGEGELANIGMVAAEAIGEVVERRAGERLPDAHAPERIAFLSPLYCEPSMPLVVNCLIGTCFSPSKINWLRPFGHFA